MSARAVHLVIDARPRGPRGLLAAELVLGRSVLDHLLDLAVELGHRVSRWSCTARGEHHQLRELAGKANRGGRGVCQRSAAGGCRGPTNRSPVRRGAAPPRLGRGGRPNLP